MASEFPNQSLKRLNDYWVPYMAFPTMTKFSEREVTIDPEAATWHNREQVSEPRYD
jgi:hypothetical protein